MHLNVLVIFWLIFLWNLSSELILRKKWCPPDFKFFVKVEIGLTEIHFVCSLFCVEFWVTRVTNDSFVLKKNRIMFYKLWETLKTKFVVVMTLRKNLGPSEAFYKNKAFPTLKTLKIVNHDIFPVAGLSPKVMKSSSGRMWLQSTLYEVVRQKVNFSEALTI